MKMSIVIPCYNEAENLPLILNRFSETITDENIEIVLVNNGSTDNSSEVLKELLPKFKFARTIFVPQNRGYGYGILQGLNSVDGDYIGWTHADMQTDPSDIVKAYRIINRKNEFLYIKGNRKGRPLFDRVFTNGMSIFETLYFGVPMYDINAQPNIFPRKFYESWENPPYDFSLDLYASYMAGKSGLKIIRFSVQFPERLHGKSKWNTGMLAKWKFIKRTIEFSVQLKKQMK